MARPPVSWTPVYVLSALVVIAGAAGGVFLYLHNQIPTAAAPLKVALGDNVTVNYIGVFGSGPESGRVFDTSLYSVATDSVTYPKALTFHARGEAKNYTPLNVHVGANTPSGGYSLGGLSFIQVVPGFWQGLLGLPGNQTHTIVVPPALGYGTGNASCVAVKPLSFQLPVIETFPGTTFSRLYPGTLATTGATFSDPHYGWSVLILSANSSFVTIENLPSVGWTASPAGWPVVVTNVSATANGTGAITIVNQLSPFQAGHLLGKDFLGTGPCTSQAKGQFIVTAVDLAHGTYTEDFNQEVVGQTLIFIVTVIDILVPTTTSLV